MRILVIGDFGGRRGAPAAPRPGTVGGPLAADPDTFDLAMARLAPALDFERPAPGVGAERIEFRSLDDFHPDTLVERLARCRALRETRERLKDPGTFVATAPVRGASESEDEMLERLLGAPARPGGGTLKDRPRTELESAIRSLVAPYIVPGPDPRRDELVAAVDLAIGRQLRGVLHDPRFQSLEGLWRSAHRLVTGIETAEGLRIELLDATREELLEDVRAAGTDLDLCALHRVLVDEAVGTPGSDAWALVVGAFEFGPGADDVELLAALGAIAARGGAALVAGASPAVLGCEAIADAPDPRQWKSLDPDAAERWTALRRSPWAPSIGLAAPRVLLRRAYGRRSDPVERFDFEELAEDQGHESHLWGNPAFACAELLTRSFTESGWGLQPGDHLEIGDLPHQVVGEGDEARLLPGAEVLLSERAADAMLARGVMPLLSYADRSAVRMVRFQSIAEPPAPLAGRWS